MSIAHQIMPGQPLPDLRTHPAVLAWRRFQPDSPPATAVFLLKKRSKTAIYKIDAVGPCESSIVAKLCRCPVAAHERIIYQQILSRLPVSHALYYGFMKESEDHDWLFLEYIEGEQYSRSRDDHAALVARWLGLLHSTAAQIVPAVQLPDRGTQYHLIHLREARDNLQRNLKLLKLPAAELAVIDEVISQCDFLESHWKRVEQSCECLPRTFVHGDLKPKNVVIRTDVENSSVYAFDWEASGWGMPTADIAYVDAAAYHEAVRGCWPEVTAEDVRIMKIIGRIFRGIEEFRWESEKVDPRWESSAIKLNYFRERMTEAIEMNKW